MKIQILLLIALLASMSPLTAHAWGKKKNSNNEKPEDAWKILLSTNTLTTQVSPALSSNEIPNVDKEQLTSPISKQFTQPPTTPSKQKTVPQQSAMADHFLSNADSARVNEDFVSAIGLYDKAIKAYDNIKANYPDWQPSVIEFRINHCTYHIKRLLKAADEGKIKLDTDPHLSRKAKPSQQEKSSSLTQARQLIVENKNQEARDVLIQALMTDPDNKRIRLMIGIVQCRLKQYNDATYLLETLIEESPGDANAHVILATAYYGLKRYDNVINQLHKALEINSFHQAANFNMAKVLMKTTPEDTEAIAKYYIKAVELGSTRDPKLDAAILHNSDL